MSFGNRAAAAGKDRFGGLTRARRLFHPQQFALGKEDILSCTDEAEPTQSK